MAQERIYDPQIAPQAAPMQTALATPASYGAGIGEEIQRAGQQLHSDQVRAFQVEEKRKQDEERAAAAHAFALHRQNLDGIELERQKGTADGYASDVLKANDAGREAVFSGITQDNVRRDLALQWDEYTRSLNDRARTWETGQRLTTELVDTGDRAKVAAARVYAKPDRLGEELTLLYADVASRGWPEAVKRKFIAEQEKELGEAAAKSEIQTDPKGLQLKLAAGAFDYLGGDTVDRLNRQAGVEIHSREVEERTRLTAAKAEFAESVNTTIGRIDAGGLVEDDVLVTMIGQAKALGDEAKVQQLTGARETNDVRRVYASATPREIADDLAELDQRIAGKGTDAPTAWLNRREAMAKVLATKRGEAANDPLAMAAKGGIALGEVNFAVPNPAQFQQREIAARAAQQATGNAVLIPLRPDETRALQQELGTGTAGRLKVLHALDNFGDDFVRLAAARQIAPQDVQLQHLTQVRPSQRDTVMSGQAARAKNPKILIPDATVPRGEDVRDMMAHLEADLALAMKAMRPEDAAAVRETARDWLAGFMWSKGHTSVDGYYAPQLHRTAVQVALGGFTQQGNSYGGLGNWSGGHPFIVADGHTLKSFGNAVVRDRQRQDAAGTGPVDLDGKTPFNLNHAWPVLIAPGRYRWETASGTVKNKAGGDYISTIGAGR